MQEQKHSESVRKVRAKAPRKRRTESKEKRKLQLIQAAIRSIAKFGLSDTTIATVSSEAGLSKGIINLHFQSKERLLLETLAFVVDEYNIAWEKALKRSDSSSAKHLAALVEVDFDKSVCDRNKLAVWFAYWGESKSRPTYRKLCAERNKVYESMLIRLCADVIQEGRYSHLEPETVARGLAAMTDGLWLNILINPRSMSRTKARNISLSHLASIFPAHFSPTKSVE